MHQKFYLLYILLLVGLSVRAGNPDRQGEAGAGQLLLNPYAPSAGLHSMTTSMVSGVEAMLINPAGLVRINKTQVMLGHALYLQGTDIRLNGLGVAQRVGQNGAFGLHLMSIDFGDIPVTTTNQPEGTGAFLDLSFFNISLSYAHVFENKVSVGIQVKGVAEASSSVSAFGLAVDAGVQYVTGPQDNFKFGIALRNIGSRMSYGGEGLTQPAPAPDGSGYNITLEQRSAGFEMPSLLHIGGSYDIRPGEAHRLTVVGNFTANSFSRDQIGGGLEYSLRDMFIVRGAYRIDIGSDPFLQPSIYSGLSGGVSLEVPLSRDNKDTRFGIDYAYRATHVFDGTHNIGLRVAL